MAVRSNDLSNAEINGPERELSVGIGPGFHCYHVTLQYVLRADKFKSQNVAYLKLILQTDLTNECLYRLVIPIRCSLV